MNVTQICTALLSLSEEDLRTINAEAVALLKHKIRVKSFEAGKSFNVGSKVLFTNSRTGQSLEGIVEKINVKSVRVRTTVGLWNVSPTLLKAV